MDSQPSIQLCVLIVILFKVEIGIDNILYQAFFC